MGEVAEEDEEAGGRVPLEPPERRLLLERWLVLEAGGRALDRLVVLAAERAVVVAAAAGLGLVELDFREAGFWEVGGGVAAWLVGVVAAGAGLALALLASPAPLRRRICRSIGWSVWPWRGAGGREQGEIGTAAAAGSSSRRGVS
ncbi:hypothetical protein [Cyanobium sp. LEGE 06113]|uniref:hypothetical protein n=1 Tax=Cyanobium sp. LEGE 06113 TaxID=1297573 RepID=UPI00187DEACC|nr:hypothetical protein [Cyanobium sp. LEGE 06113]